MIIGRLEQAQEYARLHPGLEAAFDILRSTPFEDLEPGRHDVMGDDLYLVIARDQLKGRADCKLETHQKYIDVQYIVPRAGAVAEEFGWKSTELCDNVVSAYDETKDYAFFGNEPDLWFALPPGHFVIFFPSDAHAPLSGQGEVLKAIVKIAVNW